MNGWHTTTTCAVPKQFRVGELVKLWTKNLKLKHKKIGPRWVGPFRVIERIGGQAYRLVLPEKYSRLHDVFPVQLLEPYRARDDNSDLLPMPDLGDPRDEWEVRRLRVRPALTASDITWSNGQAGLQNITRGSPRSTWQTPKGWSIDSKTRTGRNAGDGHGERETDQRTAVHERFFRAGCKRRYSFFPLGF